MEQKVKAFVELIFDLYGQAIAESESNETILWAADIAETIEKFFKDHGRLPTIEDIQFGRAYGENAVYNGKISDYKGHRGTWVRFLNWANILCAQ